MRQGQMKRILYIHHGSISGGAPRSLYYLIKQLDRTIYKPYIVYQNEFTDGTFFQESGAETIYEPRIQPFHGSTVSGIDFIRVMRNFKHAIPTYKAAKAIISNIKPDIVHINSTCLFMCAKAAKSTKNNIRVVCHVREPLLENIWGHILKIMCQKYCDLFIAIDEFDGRSVDPEMKKTTVVYNFVNFNEFNSNVKSDILRSELKINVRDTIFLVLARVSEENGILEIVKTWEKYKRYSGEHLVIVGEIPGKNEEYTNQCHKAGKGAKNIHFLPFRKDVPNVIASADAILCPFLKPHFARMIIEGAAMGKPCIAADIEGPKELVIDGQTGYLYKTNNELLTYISVLSTDYDRRYIMGKKAEIFARNNFNAEINAKKTFEVYEQLTMADFEHSSSEESRNCE